MYQTAYKTIRKLKYGVQLRTNRTIRRYYRPKVKKYLTEITEAAPRMLRSFVNVDKFTQHQFFSPRQYATTDDVNHQGRDYGIGSIRGC